MFSLIISIIAIALVVALAGATLYYGGDSFTQGNAKSIASTYTNQAQQIAAALTLAKAEGVAISALTDLNTNGNTYLASIPTPPGDGNAWVLDTTSGTLSAAVATAEVADHIQKQADASGGRFTVDLGDDEEVGGGDDTYVFIY